MKDPQIWCFNARGFIVHYALTGRLARAVYEKNRFHKLPAGNDVDSIKEELLLHGPVLSTSFKPSAAVTAEYGLETPSTVIILGWKQVQGKGEVWLVRPTPNSEVVEIPVGSCSLTDDMQIPERDLKDYPWYHFTTFSYLHRDFSGTEWTSWSKYDMVMTYAKLDTLLHTLGNGKDLDIGGILTSKREVEICPKGMKSMSR
jgi:hypothetical protein